MTSPDDILDFLDARQDSLLWLSNDGRQHLADARLTVFRSDTDWAVFVELPYYFAPVGDSFNWVGGVGTCWEDGYLQYSAANDRPLYGENPACPLWEQDNGDHESKRGEWLGDRAGFSLIINGEPLDFAPTVQDYADAGIFFPNGKSGPGSLPPGYLLHFLCHHLNHPLFASEAALRQAMGRCRDLVLFLQTGGWHHPVFLVDGENDFFSDDYVCNIPCFQVLARAIASGDLAEWRARDPAAFNTHWQSLETIHAESDGFLSTRF